MLLGTHSNAGKSLLTTAFCRILARRGIRVAPFKAQNMSNNAGVTPGGGEMGRAQIVQSAAAGVEPHTDMNPVLLKPEANRRSQIVLNGKVNGHIEAKNWFDIKRNLWPEVTAAYDRLSARFDVIIMEGAGSPAEINLKAGDIVNLRMARYAGASCLLIGDIDRGGVFASLAGTMLLLEPEEREQIQGFIINKFRGDPDLLGNATELLQQKSFGVPTLGVIPYIPHIQVADEDAVSLDNLSQHAPQEAEIDIAVIHLPHIANFDEFNPFRTEPGVQLRFAKRVDELGTPDAIILPGTKVTLPDLAWLRTTGLAQAVLRHCQRGLTTVGICGGYQMMGLTLSDPHGAEGDPGGSAPGLGILPVATQLSRVKHTHRAELLTGDGQLLSGYEIHVGESTFVGEVKPFGQIVRRNGKSTSVQDGALLAGGHVWGTYLHGIFENDEFRRRWLSSLGWARPNSLQVSSADDEFERIADIVEEALDWNSIDGLLGLP